MPYNKRNDYTEIRELRSTDTKWNGNNCDFIPTTLSLIKCLPIS